MSAQTVQMLANLSEAADTHGRTVQAAASFRADVARRPRACVATQA